MERKEKIRNVCLHQALNTGLVIWVKWTAFQDDQSTAAPMNRLSPMSDFNPPIPIMIGQRVLLRYPSHTDRDEFVALRRSSREHLERWEPIPPSGLDLYSNEAFDRELETHNTPVEQRWLICLKDTGVIVGRIALGNIERGPFQNGRFGYWIGAEHTGRGLMSEALSLAVTHAFSAPEDGGLGLHRVCANIMPSNTPSRRVLERVGLVKEGYSENYLQIQGKWEGHERWGMTASSFV